MATVTVTIPKPVLGVGGNFLVKYRVLPAGGWVNVAPNPTNAPFNITGLAAGDYEMQVQLNDDPECISLSCFTVTGCDCPGVSGGYYTTANQVNFIGCLLDFTGKTFPQCGLVITVTDQNSGAVSTFTANTLADLIYVDATHYKFEMQVTGTSYIISVAANCCGNQQVSCGKVTAITDNPTPGPCITPAHWAQAASPQAFKDPVTGQWYLYVYIIQSDPPCDTFDIGYVEKYTSTTPDSGTYHLIGAASIVPDKFGGITLKIPVNPNPDDFGGNHYQGSITDCCGNTFNFY